MRFDDGTSCEWFWLFDGEAVELVERPAPAKPAFGLFDLGMAKKIDRLLKAHGLHLTVKRQPQLGRPSRGQRRAPRHEGQERQEKMKVFASFTATLREMHGGTVTQGDLDAGLFWFNCSREHALRPWEDTTNEVLWFWRKPQAREQGAEAHRRLVAALLAAERDGRALWRDADPVESKMFFLRFIGSRDAEVVR